MNTHPAAAATALLIAAVLSGCGSDAPPVRDPDRDLLPEQIVTPAERDPFAEPGVINTPAEVRPGLGVPD